MSQDPSSTDPLAAAWSFGKLMPGFGFLEQWTKGASAAMPAMGQWVAPTLDPAELDKRIQDLRTVQFWLEQNARLISMTIQALEVQRMTLDTLKGMNVPVDALRESLKVRTPTGAAAAAEAPADTAKPEAAAAGEAPEGGGAIDPMRWWGSLTKQFTDLATSTMQDALKTDVSAAQQAAGKAAGPAAKSARKTAAAKKAAPRGKAAEAPRQASTRAQPAQAPARRAAKRSAPGTSAED